METKKEVEIVCRDFEIFCNYLLEKDVKLSKTTKYIRKKDCFALNQLLQVKEPFEKATRFQTHYPVIHFFYYIALNYRILGINYSGMTIHKGKNYEKFEQCTAFEKYMLFVVTAFHDVRFAEEDFTAKIYLRALMQLLWENHATAGNEYLMKSEGLRCFVMDRGKMTSILEELCIIHRFEDILPENAHGPDKINLKLLSLFEIAVAPFYNMIKAEDYWLTIDIEACLKPYMEFWNVQYQESNISSLFLTSETENLDGAVDLEVKIRHTNVMRVIRMNLEDTLYDLHEMIQEAVQFDNDHLFEFQFGQGMLKERYTISEAMTSGIERDVEDTSLASLDLYKGLQFSYLFDYGDEWWFDIKVLNILEHAVEKSKVIKAVGEAPEQYPCYDEEEFW